MAVSTLRDITDAAGKLRHDGSLRRNRRKPGRDDSLPGPLVQGLSWNGIPGRYGPGSRNATQTTNDDASTQVLRTTALRAPPAKLVPEGIEDAYLPWHSGHDRISLWAAQRHGLRRCPPSPNCSRTRACTHQRCGPARKPRARRDDHCEALTIVTSSPPLKVQELVAGSAVAGGHPPESTDSALPKYLRSDLPGVRHDFRPRRRPAGTLINEILRKSDTHRLRHPERNCSWL